MTPQEIFDALTEKFGSDSIVALNSETIDPWIEVAAGSIVDVCSFLKTEVKFKFEMLANLTGVDYLETDPKLAKKFPYEPHVEVVYHLLSISLKHRVTLKVLLPRWKDDQEGNLPEVPSVAGVWGIADWHEREAFDLVGINFLGHPNPLRILCPDDWEGHPLRKDYEFPLEYHGVRAK